MPGNIFYWVFNMSIAASFTGLLILPIRAIRALPRRASVFLWLVPFARMCVPVGLDSRYSLMSLISRFATKTVVVYSPSEELELSFLNSVTAAEDYFPVTYKTGTLKAVFDTAGIIWLAVSVVIIMFILSQYAAVKKEIKDARPLYDNVLLSDKVRGPAVYGILRPKIVLPDNYDASRSEYILRHERTHIRRADNLLRLLAFFAVSAHWFNPLSWLFLKLLLSDLEQACDESVISRCGADERKHYAAALLDCAESGGIFSSGFGGSGLRARIENILSYRRVTMFSSVCFALFISVIIFILSTNAG